MKRIIILAAVSALFAAPSFATDLGLDVNLGGGAVIGGNANLVGNAGFVDTKEFGGAKAKAGTEGYALAEGEFLGDFKSRGTGGDTHSHLNTEGKLQTAAGSLATTSITSKGNGGGSATSLNGSFAGGITGGVGFAGSAGLNN